MLLTSKRNPKPRNIRGKFNVQDESVYWIHHTDEETSAEFINPAAYKRNQTGEGSATSKLSTFGIVALVLSIASLFFLPVILGIAGIIVGIFATKADSKVMGIAAIVIGVFSAIAGLLVYPFF